MLAMMPRVVAPALAEKAGPKKDQQCHSGQCAEDDK
jgi:hypothetical protein